MMSEIKCIECEAVATWIRYTQFAGNHPFCDKHAWLEPNFDGDPDSYSDWERLEDIKEQEEHR